MTGSTGFNELLTNPTAPRPILPVPGLLPNCVTRPAAECPPCISASIATPFFRNPQPRLRRNPLLRILVGLLGLVVLAVLVFFSVFVGAAMLAIGLVSRLLRKRPAAPARDAQIVEGEFRVVGKA